jgi:hypothetical protein
MKNKNYFIQAVIFSMTSFTAINAHAHTRQISLGLIETNEVGDSNASLYSPAEDIQQTNYIYRKGFDSDQVNFFISKSADANSDYLNSNSDSTLDSRAEFDVPQKVSLSVGAGNDQLFTSTSNGNGELVAVSPLKFWF